MGIIDDSFDEAIRNEAEELLAKEIVEAERIVAGQDVASMFRYTYEVMPDFLQEQFEAFKKSLGKDS